MKKLLATLFPLVLTTISMLDVAEAARLGGGRSVGVQRAAPLQRQAAPPAPASQQAKPADTATTTPQPAGNRWFGPLAGIAAGLGLGWLLGQGGMAGMVGLLLIALLAGFAVMALVRKSALRRQGSGQQMQYAGLDNANVAAPPQFPAAEPVWRPVANTSPLPQPQVPAGFDTEGFLRQAKRNFVQLQEANDRADLAELREVTTEDLFETLKGDIIARGGRQQQTEVVMVDATLLEVVTEGGMHGASVRFSGSLRESPRLAPEAFEEVWNLQKPESGETGWLLAGIQQLA